MKNSKKGFTLVELIIVVAVIALLAAVLIPTFSSLISKSHEELMRVKDNDTRASFYIVQNGDLINEMIMLADTDSDYVVIRITGKFTLQDIQDVAKSFSQNDKKEVTISYN